MDLKYVLNKSSHLRLNLENATPFSGLSHSIVACAALFPNKGVAMMINVFQSHWDMYIIGNVKSTVFQVYSDSHVWILENDITKFKIVTQYMCSSVKGLIYDDSLTHKVFIFQFWIFSTVFQYSYSIIQNSNSMVSFKIIHRMQCFSLNSDTGYSNVIVRCVIQSSSLTHGNSHWFCHQVHGIQL